MTELHFPACDAGHHGSNWNFQRVSNFLVRVILEIKESEGHLVCFVDLGQRMDDGGCVHLVCDRGGDGWQIVGVAQLYVRKPFHVSARVQEFTMQRAKQP